MSRINVASIITKGIRRTDAEKDLIWQKIIDSRMEYYKRLSNSVKGEKTVFGRLFKLEFEGGFCFTCGVAWKHITFENDYLRGQYYVPQCDCFVKCPVCKTHLYDAQYEFGELRRCDNCHFHLINLATKKKRYGRDYEEWFDKLNHKMQMEQRMMKCAY